MKKNKKEDINWWIEDFSYKGHRIVITPAGVSIFDKAGCLNLREIEPPVDKPKTKEKNKIAKKAKEAYDLFWKNFNKNYKMPG